MKIFDPFWKFTNSPLDYFLFTLIVILTFLIIKLQREKSQVAGYSPRLAWMRGGIYFTASSIISILVGVLPTLINKPVVAAENLSDPFWWLFTLICAGVIYWAYFVLWPKGTLTHGRELHLPGVLFFGLLWGLSEGQIFLSVWSMSEKFIDQTWLVALTAFLVIGTFKGLWQSQYWDIYVSPDHNIPEWNLKKVLFGHVPNLMFTLSYLAVFGNAFIFLMLQTAGLMYSAYYMHFPKFEKDIRHK